MTTKERFRPTGQSTAACCEIGLAIQDSEASWKAFLSDWSGAPQVAVGDGAHGARNAVEALWPGRVLWVRCAYHWKKNLVSAVISDLVRLTGLPSESAKVQKGQARRPGAGRLHEHRRVPRVSDICPQAVRPPRRVR